MPENGRHFTMCSEIHHDYLMTHVTSTTAYSLYLPSRYGPTLLTPQISPPCGSHCLKGHGNRTNDLRLAYTISVKLDEPLH